MKHNIIKTNGTRDENIRRGSAKLISVFNCGCSGCYFHRKEKNERNCKRPISIVPPCIMNREDFSKRFPDLDFDIYKSFTNSTEVFIQYISKNDIIQNEDDVLTIKYKTRNYYK